MTPKKDVQRFKRQKNVLVIGGTGIVGKPTINHLIKQGGFNIYSIALEKTDFPSSVHQYVSDRTTTEYKSVVQKLNSEISSWEAVIDIVAFNRESAENTYSLFKNKAKHIITLSTTLVYDRAKENTVPISENTPLATEGRFGGYVDGKVQLEKFWRSVTDVDWTLLRPYHILGAESLLGCIPEHNRDPQLIQKIKNNETLKLCNAGMISFNFIHPKDIAEAIYRIIGNPKTFRQTYNLVNPQPILAADYYAEISKQIGGELVIENVPMETIWKEMKGWEMTTLPHVYSMRKLENDIGYIPNTSLEEGIRDAITHPAKPLSLTETPLHQRMNKLPHPQKPDWLT